MSGAVSYTATSKTNRTFQAYNVIQAAKTGGVWVAVGKTTLWDATDTVPTPNEGTTVEGIVGLKRADRVVFVTPDPTGDIIMETGPWKALTDNEGKAANCRWVYVEAWLNYSDFPVVTFRQDALFAPVTLKSGVPTNKQVVLPTDVQDWGFLLAVTNRTAQPRMSTSREMIKYIIEY